MLIIKKKEKKNKNKIIKKEINKILLLFNFFSKLLFILFLVFDKKIKKSLF